MSEHILLPYVELPNVTFEITTSQKLGYGELRELKRIELKEAE